MSLRGKIIKGSLTLTVGEVVAELCNIGRMVILARMLSREDFGIAAAFDLTIRLFEVTSKMAIRSLVVQSKQGDDPSFLATGHAFQAALGFTSAVILFCVSWPISKYFKIPEAQWAFQLLAVIPLCRAFTHLDVDRMVRDLRFGPTVTTNVAPQVLTFLAAWPMAKWLGDYRALLYLQILRWFVQALGSHYFATRPYRWAWRREFVAQIIKFGWPLFFNGFLMFLVFHGDKSIIGIGYTVVELSVYAVASRLTYEPGIKFVGLLSGILLPLLAKAQDDLPRFRRQYTISTQLLAIISVAISVVLILGGEQIVTLIFGDKYRGAGLVVAWLSVANAFRIIRAAPAMAAMAKGDTVNLLLTNIVRVVFGMSVMIVVANLKYPFHYIAASAMAGEVFAFFVSMIRLTMVHKVRLSDSLGAGAFALVFVAGAGILLWSGIPARGWWTMTGCVAGVLVLEAMLALLFFGDPRKFLVSLKKDSGGPVKPPAPPMIEE